MENIHEIVRTAEQNYIHGTTTFGKYVNFSMYETIERITAYLNSKHTSGDKDSLGRDKPFFNIVIAAVNIWYRATDIDRKDIRIKPGKVTHTALAFVANIHLLQWMKRTGFGTFLNQWGRTLAQYGSAMLKFVERDGELIPSVIPWSRMIVDPVDFDSLPRIEKIYKTPAQLLKIKEYDQKVVKSLIEARQTRETLEGQQKDTQAEFIEIYEVHGELSLSIYKQTKGQEVLEGDDDKYEQQMHVISYIQTKDGIHDFTLYSGLEEKDPYMLTHLIPEEGRTLAIGAVEYLFDAQWMQNHSMKAWKDVMDLASRLAFQTADARFTGRNVLQNIEIGDIFVHKVNEPLEALPNSGHDINTIQLFSTQWKVLAQELTSTPDAIRGNTMPSGTPFALGQLLGNQAGSLFEVMTENKGLQLEEILRRFVIPHLKSKMDTTEELVATLDEHDIKRIDAMYVPAAAVKQYNERTMEQMFEDQPIAPFDQMMEEANVRGGLAKLGNVRSFVPSEIPGQTWKEALKDLEWDAEVEITNEWKDKQAVLTSLSSALQTIVSLAGRPMTPEERLIFNRIMSETGTVSPLELASLGSTPFQPSPAMVGAGEVPVTPKTNAIRT